MVQTIELLELVKSLFELEALSEFVPSLLLVAHLLLKLFLNDPQPVLLCHKLIRIISKAVVELPFRLFLSHGILDLLFLQVFALHLLSFFRGQLDFLNLGSLLRFNSLVLDCGSLVI